MILLAGLVAAVLAIPGTPAEPGSQPVSSAVSEATAARRTAPDFELPTLDEKLVRLSSFRGRAVLLNFWATWCAACRVEMPWLSSLAKARHRDGLEVFGISLDEPGAGGIAAFVRAHRIVFPIVIGGQGIAGDYGGVRLLPQTFLIDRSGRIVESLTGIGDRRDLEERVRRLLERSQNPELLRRMP